MSPGWWFRVVFGFWRHVWEQCRIEMARYISTWRGWDLFFFYSGINDILCLSDGRHERVALWNIATKEFETVAPGPAQELPNSNPWFIVHGCGYDHVNGDYKIIRYVHNYHYKPTDKVD